MSQINFSDAEVTTKRKRTRGEVLLDEMDAVIQVGRLAAVVEPAMNKAPHVGMSLREFSCLSLTQGRLRDKAAKLNVRHLPERNRLASRLLAEVSAMLSEQALLLRHGTIVDDRYQRCQPDQEYRSTGDAVWACSGLLRLNVDSFHRAISSHLSFFMNSHACFAGHSGVP